jgi:hypothetical protein
MTTPLTPTLSRLNSGLPEFSPLEWPKSDISDFRKPQTFGSVEEALRDTARFYRKSLWADADCYARGWLGLR